MRVRRMSRSSVPCIKAIRSSSGFWVGIRHQYPANSGRMSTGTDSVPNSVGEAPQYFAAEAVRAVDERGALEEHEGTLAFHQVDAVRPAEFGGCGAHGAFAGGPVHPHVVDARLRAVVYYQIGGRRMSEQQSAFDGRRCLLNIRYAGKAVDLLQVGIDGHDVVSPLAQFAEQAARKVSWVA